MFIYPEIKNILPEGPSIVILKEETKIFENKKILEVSGNSKIDQSRLHGKKVLEFKSWGKHFLICFKGFYVRIHLLMFGSYRINERKEREPRLSLRFSNGELNFYSCAARLEEQNVEEVYDWETDTMSDQWNPEKVTRLLRALKNTMICDALLDQQIFTGVGNIIKNEVLFITQIHPETIVNSLPLKKIKELVAVTRDYCFDFYRWKKAFVLRKHWQIHRKGMCPRCNIKTGIKYMGKTNRRTFFCNNCQFLYQQKKIKKAI